jgi:hypothetical protein
VVVLLAVLAFGACGEAGDVLIDGARFDVSDAVARALLFALVMTLLIVFQRWRDRAP